MVTTPDAIDGVVTFDPAKIVVPFSTTVDPAVMFRTFNLCLHEWAGAEASMKYFPAGKVN